MKSFWNSLKNVFGAADEISAASAPPYVTREAEAPRLATREAEAPRLAIREAKAPSPAPSAPSAPSAPAPPAPSAPSSSAPSKPQLYFPAPPIISSIVSYQDVNNDKYLQDMETRYFLEKTIECIKYDKSWKKLKKMKRHLEGPDGYEIMYKILKLFVKRGNTNWYDLKIQQELVMDFIKHKLTKISSS